MKRILKRRDYILLSLLVGLLIHSCQQAPATTATVKNYPSNLSKKQVEALGPINQVDAFELMSLDKISYKVGKGSPQKTVLILFATWCGTCKQAMPAIDSAFNGKSGDAQILAVGRGHGEKELLEWKKQTGYSLPVIPDSTSAVFSKFANQYVPRIYVIDTSGVVLHQDFGWGEYMVKDVLDKL